jgi:hypothetical protein
MLQRSCGTAATYSAAFPLQHQKMCDEHTLFRAPFLRLRAYQHKSSETYLIALALLLMVIPSYGLLLLKHINPTLVSLILCR